MMMMKWIILARYYSRQELPPILAARILTPTPLEGQKREYPARKNVDWPEKERL